MCLLSAVGPDGYRCICPEGQVQIMKPGECRGELHFLGLNTCYVNIYEESTVELV